MMILLWRVLGFKLSVLKGAFGIKVAWVGLEFEITDNEVRATIGAKKLKDAAVKAKQYMAQKVISRCVLRADRLKGGIFGNKLPIPRGGVGYPPTPSVWDGPPAAASATHRRLPFGWAWHPG